MVLRVRHGTNLVQLFIGDHKRIRDVLWSYLENDRWTMRLICRALNHTATRRVGQLFRSLYVRAPVPDKNVDVIRVVGPLCHHLTVTIGEHESRNSTGGMRDSPSSFGRRRQQKSLSRHPWNRLLSSFHQLRALTLRVNNSNDWVRQTGIDEALVTLRIAVEQNRLPELKTFCLSPIDASGLRLLCWTGFGAFGNVSAPSRMWKQVETLDLRFHSLVVADSLNGQDLVVLKKVFYNYLRSFSKRLRVLRVIWLGSEGPSPMTLHLEAGLEDRSPIQWTSLEELWVGNIYLPFQTVTLAKQLAPSLRSTKMLRSTQMEPGSRSPSVSDLSAWVDVNFSGHTPGCKGRHSRASSVYSQSSEYSVDPAEEVSSSSRSILVYKDF